MQYTTAASISLKEIRMSDLIYNEFTFQVNDGEKRESASVSKLYINSVTSE